MSVLYKYKNTVAGGTRTEDMYSRISSSGSIRKCVWGTAALLTGLGLLSEQGFTDEYTRFAPSTNAAIIEFPNSSIKSTLAYSVSEQIALIKCYLSLNVSEISKILGVQRPSLYAWINGSSIPSYNNQQRINLIYDLADQWKIRAGIPIGELRRLSIQANKSVTDLLADSIIDRELVLSSFGKLEGKAIATPPKKAFSIREIAKQHGFEERSRSDKRRAFEIASGKY